MKIEALGDGALQVVLGERPDEATRRRVLAAARRLEAAPLAGVTGCVPGFTTLTVHYDPLRMLSYEAMVGSVRSALLDLDDLDPGPGRTVAIPVCYGGEHGPDLAGLAARHGMTPGQVVEIHAAGSYRVHLLGFMPGFPYLGGLDARLATPRRDQPRTLVHAGSVGIGGAQTGIYPLESPGGWHLIGRTPLRLFAPEREPAALLRPGDLVRFQPIDAAEFDRLRESA